MLYFKKIQDFFRITDKNISKFNFGPFENIRIKGKRQEKKESLQANNLKPREDRIGKYKNIFFIKENKKFNIHGLNLSQNNTKNLFDGLILHKIDHLEFINENKLLLIENYKFNYYKIEILPNITFFYVNNLYIDILPLLNGLFGKYLYSFKYIISDHVKFNLPFEIKLDNVDILYGKTNNLLNTIKKLKENKTLVGKTLKEKLNFQLQNILSDFISLLTNFYIIIINSLRTKQNLEKLQSLPNILEEYKAHGKLLESTLDLNIERYQLIYQKLLSYFQQYHQLLIKEINNFLES